MKAYFRLFSTLLAVNALIGTQSIAGTEKKLATSDLKTNESTEFEPEDYYHASYFATFGSARQYGFNFSVAPDAAIEILYRNENLRDDSIVKKKSNVREYQLNFRYRLLEHLIASAGISQQNLNLEGLLWKENKESHSNLILEKKGKYIVRQDNYLMKPALGSQWRVEYFLAGVDYFT